MVMAETAKRGVIGKTDDTEAETDGFRASLNKATLPDLVQMECLAQSDASFRVISGGRVGYLFFQRGQLVQALVDDSTGDEAALEILAWRRGTFEPCRVALPGAAAVRSGWQELLLNSARLVDESQQRVMNAARAPARSEDNVRPPVKQVWGSQVEEPASNRPAPDSGSAPVSTPDNGASHEFVRLDRSGNVVSGRGDMETLAQVASYAGRLAHLIGDALGMGGFCALEAALDQERKFVQVDAQGGMLALVAPATANLSTVRKKLDL
jgi:Domain of unknown function (DUF4388)